MKKYLLIGLLLLLFSIPIQASAGDLSDEQLRYNKIDTALQSVVKIYPSLSERGSGFFITQNLILTNAHVVLSTGAPPITLTKYDGTSCTGKATYRDERSDLALVEVSCDGTPLRLAQSVTTGQDAYVIGNSAQLGIIVTSGIVSKVDNRSIWNFHAVLTDAEAREGNSGGPIIDSEGNVIAILRGRVHDVPYINVGVHFDEIESFLRRAGVEYGNRSEPA